MAGSRIEDLRTVTQGRNNRPTPFPHRLHPTVIPHSSSPGQQATTLLEFQQQATQCPSTPLKHPRKTIRGGTNHLLRPNEQHSTPTGKQMRRLATGGAFHKTVFSPKYRSAVQVPSQRTASTIAARCISTCSALHPAHQPSAILTAPAIPRLYSKPAAPCQQVSKPFQTLPPLHPSHFKPTPLSLPDSPHHPSPSAQSPPSSPPTSVRLPTRNCRFTYPPLPSPIPTTATRFLYPASRLATAHKKPAPNPVKIVL